MVEFIPYGLIPQSEMLRLVLAIESSSSHPIAKAIVSFIKEQLPPASIAKISEIHRGLSDVEEIPGNGMWAKFDGQPVIVGSRRFLLKEAVDIGDVEMALTV